MKRFAITIALTCVLSGAALAGEIPSVGVTPPPPGEPPAPTEPGDIPTSGFTQQVTETALTLIQFAFGAVL